MAAHPEFPNGCPWLVEVRSNHPEPDSPADMWITVECGGRVSTVDGYPDGWRCEHGHEHLGIAAEWAIDGAIETLTRGRDLSDDEYRQARGMFRR